MHVEDAKPPPRHNQDPHEPNQYGRILLDMCRISGLRTANGRSGTDAGVGNFTCITDRSANTIDYILVEAVYLSSLNDFSFLDRLESIHMPVVLGFVFQFGNRVDIPQVLPSPQPEQPKYIWKTDKQEIYMKKLC